MTQRVSQLLARKQVVVCCGAGGVGKTTVSASLALSAAQAGQRVIVVTVDPSKRLAETLGISPDQDVPVELDRKLWNIQGAGSLSAWLLDPKRVADNVVKTCADDVTSAESLIKKPNLLGRERHDCGHAGVRRHRVSPWVCDEWTVRSGGARHATFSKCASLSRFTLADSSRAQPQGF